MKILADCEPESRVLWLLLQAELAGAHVAPDPPSRYAVSVHGAVVLVDAVDGRAAALLDVERQLRCAGLKLRLSEKKALVQS
jgi:hypothetical protein